MSANTKVSALDHAMHIAHTWVNDVAKEFDTDDREFAYRVLRAWLHTLRDRLTVEAAAHFAAQLPDLIRGVFYAGWNPSAVPEKYNAEAYAVRFAREANISLQTSARRLRRPPPPCCTTSRLPRWTRPWISFPAKSGSYYNPSRRPGRPCDNEFNSQRTYRMVRARVLRTAHPRNDFPREADVTAMVHAARTVVIVARQ